MRLLAAALLAALLLASFPAMSHHLGVGAQLRFQVVLSSNTLTEGGSAVTVSVRCTADCNTGVAHSATYRISTATITLRRTGQGMTGVALSANKAVSFEGQLGTDHATLGTATGTHATPSVPVTISYPENTATHGDRTITVGVSSTASEWGYGPNRYWYFWNNTPIITSATLTALDNELVDLTLEIEDADSTIDESGMQNSTRVRVTRPAGTYTSGVTATLSPATSTHYTLTGTTLTIPATGVNSNWVTLTADDDDIDGADSKTVTLTATTTTTGYRGASATLTINDDDTTGLTVVESGGDTEVTEASGADNTDTFTVALSSEPTAQVTVDVEVTGNSDECEASIDGGSNYLAVGASGRLTFVPTGGDDSGARTSVWDTAQTVRVRGKDDNTDDDDQTCTVTLDPDSAATLGDAKYRMLTPSPTVDVTVLDDEVQVALVLSRTTIDETDQDPMAAVDTRVSTVTARLGTGETAASDIRIDVSFAPTSPATASDYSLSANRRLTIAMGDATSTGVVTITAVDNDVDAADKTVTVRGRASGGNAQHPTDVPLTIADDDTAGFTVTQTGGATAVSEPQTEDTFTVVLDSRPTANVTVTATAGSSTEYEVKSGSGAYGGSTALTFAPAAWDTAQTVTVRARDDNSNDGSHTSNITLAAASTGDANYNDSNVVADQTVSVTVADDDMPGLAVVQSGGSTAVSEPQTMDSFTVALATLPTATVTVAATAGDSTECEVRVGSGAYGNSATLTFTPSTQATLWSAPQTVTVRAKDDDANDEGQACNITLNPSSPGAGGDSDYDGLSNVVVDVTVADDDTPNLAVVESDGATVVSEPQTTDSFTVALATLPTATVTVAATAGDSTECEVRVGTSGAYANSVTLTFTTTTWSTPQTLTVRAKDDNDQDPDQECDITLNPSSPGGTGDSDYDGLSNVRVDVTVRDNEVPTVTLSLSPDTISERGGTATVTASLSYGVSAATTVDVSAAAGTGAAAGDFRLSTNRRLAFAPNATFSTGVVTIAAVDNRVDAPDKTVTVSGTTSGGQGAGNPLSVTLTIEDDEAAPTVTLSPASAAIWEDGGTTAVSARLSHASSGATTITLTAPAGTRLSGTTLTVPANATASTETVTVTAVDNTARADADLTVSIAGTAVNSRGVGHVGAVTAARLTIWDDETASVSLSLEPSRVAEGGTARVSARMDGNRPARAAVTLTVAAAAGTNATASSFALGSARTLTIAAGSRTSGGSVEIEAVDDDVDAPDRMVTVTAAVGAGSRARQPAAVTLTIADDDETPRVILALAPAMIDESGETNAAMVTATLERASSEATTVAVSAAGSGFRQRGTELTIAAGATASAGTVTLTAVDDEERNEDREVRVSGRASNAHGIEQPAAVVLTIRDDDGTEAVTELLLPEAARAMADSRAAAVRRRLEQAASGAAAAPELPTLTGLLERHGPSAQEEGLEWKKTLLPQASFVLPLDDEDGGGGITLWGSGGYTALDGEARGVKWDGEVASAHAGADRLLANGLRLGLAASWSEAKFDYEHRNRAGEWTLEMGSAQPYLGWTAPGGAELWASAGVGSGELAQDFGGGRRETAEADMHMAAAGARAPLRAADDGLAVSVRGEALYAKFEVDDNGGRIRGHESKASRLRLAVEARRERVLESGAVVSPRLEVGARHDGGDGETGAGAELGAGLGYASGRLSAALGARALVANSSYDEWGADLSLAYAAGADGRGLTFRLAPAWGAARSGTAALWEQGAPGLDGAAAEPERGGRMAAELGYGLKSPLSRGLLTLAAGGEWGEDADAVCRLSGIVALDATSTLGLELTLREPQSGDAERSLMLKAELKF